MKINYRLAVPLIAGVLIAVFLLLPSEEDRVLAQLEEIRALSEVSETRSPIQQALTAKQIGAYAQVPLSLDLSSADAGIHEITEQQQIAQAVLKVRSHLDRLELRMHDPRVTISDNQADVELLGSALGNLKNAGEPFHEIHRLVIFLTKVDGTWRVNGARHIRNERPEHSD